jgi:hypothetical protein
LASAFRVVHLDRFAPSDDVERVDRDIVLAHVVEALGRAGVIVERDARRNDVDERRPFMLERGLDERHQLRLVAGKAARHERGAKADRHADEIDRLVKRARALLALRTAVCSGGKLSLGQPVHAVVLDDIDHVDAPPHGVGELAEPDRRRVTVAGDAEVDEVAVGEIGAGQHRGHAPVH